MSDKARAWKLGRSIQLALICGGIAGLVTVGVTYNSFVGDLEPQESLITGAGVALGLTLILTCAFDQLSQTAQNVVRATRRGRRRGNAEEPPEQE